MKILHKIGIIFAAFFILCLCISASDQKDPKPAAELAFPPTNYTQLAAQYWKDYLNSNIKKGDSENAIKKLMVSMTEDWGRIDTDSNHGYKLLFKLDDYQQAEFDFAGTNGLGIYTNSGYSIFLKRELWLKDPDGRILYQGTNGI